MATDLNYTRMAEAIRFLTRHVKAQPSLEEVAAHVSLSPFHFQRMFTEWAGISPKKFLQFLTVQALKQELAQSRNLLSAADAVGLSAQSRVYDLFVTLEAVTPQEFRTQGQGLAIAYGLHPTPFGDCLVAVTERGICALSFVTPEQVPTAVAALQAKWGQARVVEDQEQAAPYVQDIFAPVGRREVKLFVQGTRFQVKVWEALLKIPFGVVASYHTVASLIESPGAMRAAGTAIGSNPVAFLIPCHRVIRSEGVIGHYLWGPDRKAALIGWEKARLPGVE